MRNALALVLLVGCGAVPMVTTTPRLDQSAPRLEEPCDVQACGGGGEVLPATLVGLAVLLGVTVVHELRGM